MSEPTSSPPLEAPAAPTRCACGRTFAKSFGLRVHQRTCRVEACDTCGAAAIVTVNGRRGCAEHIDDAMAVVGEQVRAIREALL